MYEKAKIVTFASYYNPMLAYIILSKLKDNGVRCFIADDNFLQARPYLNQATGGLKIKVFEKDIKKCQAIVAADTRLEVDEAPELETAGQVRCPYCGSGNLRYGDAVEFKFNLPSVLICLVLRVSSYFRNTWHCFHCSRDFDRQSAKT